MPDLVGVTLGDGVLDGVLVEEGVRDGDGVPVVVEDGEAPELTDAPACVGVTAGASE